MRYEEFKPATAADCVAQFWRFEAGALNGAADHLIPPDGMVSIWVSFRPDAPAFAGVTGPAGKAHRTTVYPDQIVIGARLRPEYSGLLLDGDARALFGKFLPLTEVCAAADPFERCARTAAAGDWAPLDAHFAKLAASAPPPDPIVRAMARTLIETDGAAAIGAFAAALEIGPRQARRRFEKAVGMPPKAFARIRRVRRACADAIRTDTTWSAVSLEAGFADQSHLARSFQAVFDLPPTKVRAYIRRIAHGEVFDR